MAITIPEAVTIMVIFLLSLIIDQKLGSRYGKSSAHKNETEAISKKK